MLVVFVSKLRVEVNLDVVWFDKGFLIVVLMSWFLVLLMFGKMVKLFVIEDG